jgi:hypothetical protein
MRPTVSGVGSKATPRLSRYKEMSCSPKHISDSAPSFYGLRSETPTPCIIVDLSSTSEWTSENPTRIATRRFTLKSHFDPSAITPSAHRFHYTCIVNTMTTPIHSHAPNDVPESGLSQIERH